MFHIDPIDTNDEVELDEPHDEFHEMQECLDRAGWVGTGCTRAFKDDREASDHKSKGKKEPRD